MVYKRGKTYYTDFMHAGVRIRKRIGPVSKATAARVEASLREKYIAGQLDLAVESPVEPSVLKERFLSWIQSNRSVRYKERTQQALEKIIGGLGVRFVNAITPQRIEVYKRRRLKEVSPSTVNIELRILKAMLNRAVSQGWISKSVVPRIDFIKAGRKVTAEFLARDEVNRLLDASPSWLRFMIQVMVSTGLRAQEAVYLEWQDIDLERAQLHVRNKPGIGFSPKNARERIVPIPDELLVLFEARKKGAGWVFPTERETPRKNNLRRALATAGRRAGLQERVHPHLLRHTYGSHLAMAGVDLPTIREFMGHSSIQTTMIYAHLQPAHLRSAVNKLRFMEEKEEKIIHL